MSMSVKVLIDDSLTDKLFVGSGCIHKEFSYSLRSNEAPLTDPILESCRMT